MNTRGLKKAEAEPTPPARDPHDIKIPEFTGKVHLDDFVDWLNTVERVFDVRYIPDKLKVKLVAIKLQKHASLWWDHVNKRQQIEGKSKIKAKSRGSTSHFTPPTRFSPPTAPKATTPTTSAAAFVPDDACPIYDTEAEPDLDEPDDELVYLDRGEALVI
nr:reverse transcriptase domain-containing protein [Tanacetum cinerariifolium]